MSTDEDIEHYARYPFLNDAREYVLSTYSLPSLVENEEVINRAKGRIVESITSNRISDPVSAGEISPNDELASYLLARVIVSILDEPRVLSTYARTEAEVAKNRLKNNSDVPLDEACAEFDINPTLLEFESIAEQSALFDGWDEWDEDERETHFHFLKPGNDEKGWNFGFPLDNGLDKTINGFEKGYSASTRKKRSFIDVYSVSLNPYLEYAAQLPKAKWNLPNRGLVDGRVVMVEPELYEMLERAIKDRISASLPIPRERIAQELGDLEISDVFGEALEEVQSAIPDSMFSVDIDRVEQELFPPLIQTLIQRIQDGENLKHKERFAAAAFLINIGMTDDEILELFGARDENVPEFVESNTQEQLDHIRTKGGDGEPYTPPTYETISSWGTTWEMDALEEKVSHPLGYYRIKLKDESSSDNGS